MLREINCKSSGYSSRVDWTWLTGGSASELESAYDLAQFVIDFMDSMKIDKAIIMGHSMGAVIALTLIINFPERVSKLIIADSSGLGREITPIFRFLTLPLFGELLYKMTYKEDLKSFSENKRNTSQNPAAISDELIEQLYLRENRKDQYRTTLKFLRKICNWFGQKREFSRPIIEGLPNIDIPVLVVWGDKDDIVPWQHGEFAPGIIPNARLEVINNCGHVPMFDQPDELNSLLLNFLNE